MFTGLVEDVGTVAAAIHAGDAATLRIRTRLAPEIGVGDSVAVDGACLTAVARDDQALSFTAVAETLQRTTLGTLREGSRCNLERALRLSDRLGGHLVQGHIDAVGRIERRVSHGESLEMTVILPAHLLRYVVEKGSVAVDGISLTVTAVDDRSFSVALIPHTLENTTLGEKVEGAAVNLETDLLARYVEKLVRPSAGAGVTLEFLREHGFA